MLLKDKKIIVTGAAHGIGQATAQLFVKNGASVLITDKSKHLEEIAKTLKGYGEIKSVIGDICDDNHLMNLIKICRKDWGGLDVLVNNAGMTIKSKLGMTSKEDTQNLFETNVYAIITLSQYAIRAMTKSKSPVIINIASIAGTQGMDGLVCYSASKAAVVGFTLSAAKELACNNIRVNAIAPGFTDTAMNKNLSEEEFEEQINNIGLRRAGRPEDVANCALYLASDLSSYITGQVIGVDGGMKV
jgi:3-oxoacyl-[acyl-carrier protein] reductase